MENSTDLQIDIETYQSVMEQALAVKDREILALRLQLAQIEKNFMKPAGTDVPVNTPDNIINPEVKGI